MSIVASESESDDDPMLLHPGLNRPPYRGSEAGKIKESWKLDSTRKNRVRPVVTLSKGGVCAVAIFVFISLIIAVSLGYTAGFLVGHYLQSSDNVGPTSHTKAAPKLSNPPSTSFAERVDSVDVEQSNGSQYNWGSKVTVNGNSVKVSEVFADNLDANDIHDYLE